MGYYKMTYVGKFEGKHVSAINRSSWDYDDVSADKVKSLNPKMHEKVQAYVNKLLDNYKLIQDEEQAWELYARHKTNLDYKNEFQRKVKELLPADREDLKLTFNEPDFFDRFFIHR